MNPIKYGYNYQEIFPIYGLLSSWSATYRFRKRGPQLVSLVNLQLWCLSWLKFPAQAERLVAQSFLGRIGKAEWTGEAPWNCLTVIALNSYNWEYNDI